MRSPLRLHAEGGASRYKLNFRAGGIIGANAFALPDGNLLLTDELVKLAGDAAAQEGRIKPSVITTFEIAIQICWRRPRSLHNLWPQSILADDHTILRMVATQ